MLIREGKLERNNIFDTTIRDRPKEWTASVWREVYDFQPGGNGLANQTDLYIEGKFQNDVDPKDGFLVRDCSDPRERKLLEFLVPILHPDKSRSTKTQVVPSSALNMTKHHQSNPSNVPRILYSSFLKRGCIYASKFLITRSNRIPSL